MTNSNNLTTLSNVESAKALWGYNQLNQPPSEADLLLVMGTNDLNVPEYAADLYQQYSYKYVVVSGGVSHIKSLHGKPFGGSESEVFFKTLIDLGVPANKILLENEAKNTGENVTLTKELLLKENLEITSGQLVHTQAMERRAYATAEKQWPSVRWRATSFPIDFETYITGLDVNKFINNALVGNSFRVLSYPVEGFQTKQDMPENIKMALKTLINEGYNSRVPDDWEQYFIN